MAFQLSNWQWSNIMTGFQVKRIHSFFCELLMPPLIQWIHIYHMWRSISQCIMFLVCPSICVCKCLCMYMHVPRYSLIGWPSDLRFRLWRGLAPYGSHGCNVPRFISWLQQYINVCSLTFFLACSLSYLSSSLRIGPFVSRPDVVKGD